MGKRKRMFYPSFPRLVAFSARYWFAWYLFYLTVLVLSPSHCFLSSFSFSCFRPRHNFSSLYCIILLFHSITLSFQPLSLTPYQSTSTTTFIICHHLLLLPSLDVNVNGNVVLLFAQEGFDKANFSCFKLG